MKTFSALIIPRFEPSYSISVRADNKYDALAKATLAARKEGEVQFIEIEESDA